jgi:hypothetical protein
MALPFHPFARPLERHVTLLSALLAAAPVARPAALRWLETVDFDQIDVGEQRLMPFFDSRLRELGIDHASSGRVRGLYRRAWYVEQIMHNQLDGVLKVIGEVTATAVILKGAALGRLVYDRPVHRPYDDFDILVPYEMQSRVVEAMRRAGGTICPPSFHATTVRMPGGLAVDIHRSPYHMAFQAEHVRPLFTRLRRIEAVEPVGADSMRRTSEPWVTLSFTDHFLHTLMHGLSLTTLPPIRWIVDAALLLRREDRRIDWDLLVDEIIRLDFVEPAILGLHEVLRYEPNDNAARVLTELERRPSRPSVMHADVGAQHLGLVWLWEVTRRNAGGPMGRIRLMTSFFLARYGLRGLLRRFSRKVVPLSMVAMKALFKRRDENSGRSD